MDKLRWIHLSDIHFSGDEDYEVTRMRDSIADKLKELTEGKIINFVVVSGDLVYQNGSYDAKLLSSKLNAASSVTLKQVFYSA